MSHSVNPVHSLVMESKQPPSAIDCQTDREKRMECETLILSLGNPLRHDDGVGAAVLQQLASMDCLPQGVKLLDGGLVGLELIILMQDFQRVILVDAADLGLQAGEWVCLPLCAPQAHLRLADHPTSSHILGLAEALSFGRAMDLLPPELLFYGVQPKDIGWSSGLSERVQQAVPAICASIMEVLAKVLDTGMAIDTSGSCQIEFEPSAVTIGTARYLKG